MADTKFDSSKTTGFIKPTGGRVQLTPALNVLALTLDVVFDQLSGGVGRLQSAFVPFDWLLKWSSCSR